MNNKMTKKMAENGKKLNLGSDFGWLGQNLDTKIFFVSFTLLDVRHCRNPSSYVILRKTYDPNS